MISLNKVLEVLKNDGNFREVIVQNEYFYDWKGEVYFEKLSYDSRKVDQNTLFFAKGLNFKREYLENLTIPFYVSELDYQVDSPAIIVSDVKRAMSLIAQAFYDYPQNKLKLLAITGTKGKTTAAYFAKSILDEFNGRKTALLSTADTTLDGVNFFKSKLTTPESLDLIQMMSTAVQNGMTHLVMEVSSQAYKTERVYGLTFDVGIFLNFSEDHIGPVEHPTLEDYLYCKRQLIHHSHYFVANSQLSHFELIKGEIEALEIPHDFYGAQSENKIVHSQKLHFTAQGKINSELDIRLLGGFNQENALAAALATKALGASLEHIKKGLATAVVPGRMELLSAKNGAHIYIDYAHNGISLENLIHVVEEHHNGRLLLVLGATGNKGESRRKDFAHVIEAHPQIEVILTTDDSNYENPADIAGEIASHVTRKLDFEADREEAIKRAIALSSCDDDAVIIAGKGADKYQLINGKREPYLGDSEIAQKYL